MALQQDKLFITKTAFDTYRDVSEHMDDARMNASILEAQVVDVIDAVSAPIYSLMQADFTAPDTWATQRFDDLFNGLTYKPQGSSYDVIFHGVQPMLTLYAYARMLANLQLAVTRSGPVTFTEADVSDPTVQAQIKTKTIDARAMAVKYQEEVTRYLESNRSTYPEWTNLHVKNKTFQFIKL